MDAIRVPKVEDVTCTKGGQSSVGSLHLTAHHLIFRRDQGEEMWVPYPLISLVTRLPSTLQGQSPLTVRTRTFESFTLGFSSESESSDVFENVKELTVAISVNQLYAFFYTPNPPFTSEDGWNLYSPREEFGRMGVGTRSKAWRFTDINKDYSFCPTYPARLVVPTRISDTTLQYASKYRSKCRIPALVYLHWANFGSITRSSQPMVGLTQNRSVQDEKLIEAIFQSHYSPDSRVSASAIYGATATNLIIDARPTTNALANSAKGAGTENMDHYKEAKKAYLGIDNIHVVRDSLTKVVEALDPVSEFGVPFTDRGALRRSGWLRHVSAILEGTVLVVRNVHVNSSHVLVHCSDGWDRTSQLSSLAQLCLDPYYRTTRGFQVLIEKDWLSFGHKFLDRCGHLSSEKFFLAPTDGAGGGGGAEAAQAFFASVQNRFAGQSHLKETSPVFHQFLECVRQIQRQFPERFEFNERFLRQLHYHLYSCQFGTFLYNCERERRVGEGGEPAPCERTKSVWDFLNSEPEGELNVNPLYDKELDDPKGRDMGVLMPNAKDVRFWNELYGKTDDEMNGRAVLTQVQGVDVVGPVEEGTDDPVQRALTPTSVPLPPQSPSPSASPSLSPAQATSTEADMGPTEGTSAQSQVRGSAMTDTTFRPYPTTASTISMKRPDARPARSPSPATAQRRGPDLLGVGVKSIWGRFSSNATAALTAAQGAVQGAYDGVTRDLKVLSVSPGPGDLRERGGELQSPNDWNAGSTEWDDAAGPSNPRAASTVGPPAASPWASTGHGQRLPSMVLDNPWNSVRSPPAGSPGRKGLGDLSLFDASSPTTSKPLPPDPTVEHPVPRPAPLAHRSSSIPHVAISPTPPPTASTLERSSSVGAPQTTRPPDSDLDPLGVGLS